MYCITIREQDKLTFMDTTICPGAVPRIVQSPFTIFSGFPPGTWSIPELRPKWQQEYKISADANTLLEYDASYYPVSKEISGWRREFLARVNLTNTLLIGVAVNEEYGCAVDCYLSQERMKNPYYKFNIGDGRPDFSNHLSGHTGWHFTPPPDYCSNLNSLDDQRANEPVEFLPLADASKLAEGTSGNLISTPNFEGLDDPDELVGYAQLPQPNLTTEDPSVSFSDSSKWNVKRGVVRKEGAAAISLQA